MVLFKKGALSVSEAGGRRGEPRTERTVKMRNRNGLTNQFDK